MDASHGAPAPEEVTRILSQVTAGVPEADERLLRIVYGELKRIAAGKMAAQDPEHTLQPTALVHEAYLRLFRDRDEAQAFNSSAHFFKLAAAAMRSILVDHARAKLALKRGGDLDRVTLSAELVGEGDPVERVLRVHEALERLAARHPRTAEIVELLFFAGLTTVETASLLGLSPRTVEREWRFARATLLRMMGTD